MLKQLTNFSLKMFTVLFPSEKPLLFTGRDSTIQLASLAQASGSKRPLLVTEKFLLKLGLLDEVLEHFKNEGCDVTIFDGVIPNPTYDVIEDGIGACQENHCDSIFAVGGGSTIDAAKVIAACYSNNVGVEQVVGLLKVKQPTLPFYVVPTTSGTGSEVTNSAVISETKTHQKKFVVDPKLIPSAAALDANMLKSLPPHITAATGMDALTHAIESYTSLNRFSDAERDAKLAIKLLLENLPVVYEDGNNLEARQLVALASFLAAYAFNKSGLGYVHAISHQLSAHYNTPHGLTNAVILPRILRFNKPVCADRFANLERMLSSTNIGSDEQLADRFIARVDALSERLNIPRGFKELETKHYDTITRNALQEAKSFYAVPRLMNRVQCQDILASIVQGAKAGSPLTSTSQVNHSTQQSVSVAM